MVDQKGKSAENGVYASAICYLCERAINREEGVWVD